MRRGAAGARQTEDPCTAAPVRLEARGRERKTSESDPASAIIDDYLILVILGTTAIADTIAQLTLIMAWECWAGVSVNLKSGCAAYDYAVKF